MAAHEGERQPGRDMDLLIGNVLRVGVLCAAALGLAGGLFFFLVHGSEPAATHALLGERPELRTVHGVVAAAAALQSTAIMQLAVLVLVATPIARVVLALAGFAQQRDLLYVLICAVVLAVLAFSLLTGVG